MIVYHELRSIERELGFSVHNLYGLSNNIGKHYRSVKITSKNGKQRTLSIPDKVLMRVQRAIADRLLAYEPVSNYATAYRPGTSIKRGALPHVGRQTVLKLDICHFFDSISYPMMKKYAFPEGKYSEKIRILLSMLCYRTEGLPQGAPTSPVISNIVLRDFDETVGEWCRERSISYTRYCDDMTFSGALSRDEVIKFVSGELQSRGFLLNKEKTRVQNKGTLQTVTGITVNIFPNSPKTYRREIRSAVYYCTKFGAHEHLSRIKYIGDTVTYLRSLLGKINFVLNITPHNEEFKEYKREVEGLISIERK